MRRMGRRRTGKTKTLTQAKTIPLATQTLPGGGGGLLPITAYTGRFRFRLQVCERVRISLFEV